MLGTGANGLSLQETTEQIFWLIHQKFKVMLGVADAASLEEIPASLTVTPPLSNQLGKKRQALPYFGLGLSHFQSDSFTD